MVTFLGRHTTGSIRFGPFLVSIFGLGKTSAKKISLFLGVGYSAKFSSIDHEKLFFLQAYLSSYILESDLKRFISGQHQAKIKLLSYPGLRLTQGLPSRGQRTKSNAQTSKKSKIKSV